MLWRKVLKEAMNLNFLRFFTGTKPRVIAVDERPSDDDIEGPKDERAGDAQAPASGKELRSDALLSTFTDWPRLYQIDAQGDRLQLPTEAPDKEISRVNVPTSESLSYHPDLQVDISPSSAASETSSSLCAWGDRPSNFQRHHSESHESLVAGEPYSEQNLSYETGGVSSSLDQESVIDHSPSLENVDSPTGLDAFCDDSQLSFAVSTSLDDRIQTLVSAVAACATNGGTLQELSDVLEESHRDLHLSWKRINRACRNMGLCLSTRRLLGEYLREELVCKYWSRLPRGLLRGRRLKAVRRAFCIQLEGAE